MFDKFKADMEVDSTYDINFEDLYSKGVRGLIFDIDNTLVPHDAPGDAKSDELMRRLSNLGYEIYILSNNNEERVKLFLQNGLTIPYIAKSGKPSKTSYLKAFEDMNLSPDKVVAVGDQLLTDCMGAKNAGIKFIKVGIISKKEPLHIRLKRIIEKIIYIFI